MDIFKDKTVKNFILVNIAAACLYFIFGKFAGFLAVPPSYAKAVWPSAGIALAFMLRFGRRVIPGIFLGSYILNILAIPGDLSFSKLTFSGLLALGSASNPLIGVTLLEIWRIRVKDLINIREIVGVIVCGGALGCILSASFGTVSLYAFNIITLDDFSHNWLTWWTGDTLGVLIFTPITILLFNTYKTNRSRVFTVIIPMLLSFGISILIYVRTSERALQEVKKDFNSKSYEVEKAIRNAVKDYTDVLMALKAFYESTEDISVSQFRSYTRFFLRQEKGIQALEWIPAVEAKDRKKLEKELSQIYKKKIVFTKRDAGQLIEDDIRNIYFPVTYVEPYDGNEVVVGYNIGSDEKRQDALRFAKDNNEIVSSQLIKLVQGRERILAIILFVPIYNKSSFEFIGYINGVFKIRDILKSALSEIDLTGVEYVLTQDESGDADEYMVKSFKNDLDLKKDILLENIYQFEIGKKHWTFRSLRTKAYATRNKDWGIWLLFSTSLFFISLLGVILLIVSGQTEKISQEVKTKTLALKTINDDLRESSLKIEQISKYKSEFLANMSHEIRTPLNGILGMINTIDEEPLSEKQKSSLDIIKLASENLYVIINDILDFSKIEAGKMSVEILGFDLHKNIEGTFFLFKGQAEEKQVSLKLFIEPNCPRFIMSDPVRLSQIFANLLSNAIKFTHEGNIFVKVSHRIIESGESQISISVKDSGIGMSEDTVNSLFNPFCQADSSITRMFGGTGLGLVISQKLANLLGGNITVKSELGIGTEFTLDLSVEVLQSIEEKSENSFVTDKGAYHSLKVLVAEDNHINQKVIASLMQKFDIKIDLANNGSEAVNMCLIKKYDLIFMDLQMPEVDGFEATKSILVDGVNKNTPVIAMTANVFKEDRDRCINYGMKDFIEKPIKIHEIRKVLGKCINGCYDK